jgi:hypothetical protein
MVIKLESTVMQSNAFFGNIKPNLIVICRQATNTIHTAIQYQNHSALFFDTNLLDIHQLILSGDQRKLPLLDSKYDIQNIRIQPYSVAALQQLSNHQVHYENIFLSQVLVNGSICMMSLIAGPAMSSTPAPPRHR